MVEANLKYGDDPQLLLDIVSVVPKRLDNTLALHRNKILGNLPDHRNDFNPEALLNKVEEARRSWSWTH